MGQQSSQEQNEILLTLTVFSEIAGPISGDVTRAGEEASQAPISFIVGIIIKWTQYSVLV